MANLIKQTDNFPSYLLAFPNQADPRGRNRSQVSAQSWFDAYREQGILFVAAENCEANSLAPTIAKVANYAMHGRLKIFATCTKLKASLAKYKYPARKVGEDTNQGETPVDAHNHLPDALRYLMAPFPAFPEDPQDFNYVWREVLDKLRKETHDPTWMWNTPADMVGSFMDNFG
jgi:hypothetical protein